MPIIFRRQVMKDGVSHRSNGETNFHGSAARALKASFSADGKLESITQLPAEGYKSAGMDWSDRSRRGQDFMRVAGNQALHADRDSEGVKQHGSGHIWYRTGNGALPSASKRRKAASAMIAKIPFPLAQHIAHCYKHEKAVTA